MIALGVVGYFFYPDTHSLISSNHTETTTKLETTPHSGDLIFRKGTGAWSPLFSGASENGFSHVGVIHETPLGLFVLHSEADDFTLEGGIQNTPLQQFIKESDRYTIKHNLMSEKQKQAFIQELIQYQTSGAVFDTDFSLEGPAQQLYCSEYVWKSAQNIGVQLGYPSELLGKDYITVDSILESPNLE